MKNRIFFIYCLLIGGCVSRSVERSVEPFSPKEIKECITRLEEQSFEFEIRFAKPGTSGNFKGVAIKGNAKVNGFWEFDGKREKVKVIGIGEKEYKWENRKWQEGSRTNMSNPVATLELVCSVGEWRFKELEEKSFIYDFKPNLLFMDPRLIETKGLIWIDAETKVPEKILAETENIRWEFEIKSIGEEYEILNPSAKKKKIEVVASCKSLRVAQILKERFELYWFNRVEYKLKGNTITLSFLAQMCPESLIKTLLEPGNLELYKADYTSGSDESRHFVCGDPTKPVVLKEKLQQELVDISFEGGFMEFTFDKELPEGKSIAVMVDNKIIGFVPEVWGKEIKIEGDRDDWIKIKFPLPCQLTILKGG
ncbi:hypothetical protein KAW50_00590 [candidate division WOR-3 bacterium]|nr:hypothetical protein [candidate division WOR-3 bacterium]